MRYLQLVMIVKEIILIVTDSITARHVMWSNSHQSGHVMWYIT